MENLSRVKYFVKIRVAFWVSIAVQIQCFFWALYDKNIELECKIHERSFVRPGKTTMWIYWISFKNGKP